MVHHCLRAGPRALLLPALLALLHASPGALDSSRIPWNATEKLCSSGVCSVDSMMWSIDTTAEPCQDFFHFVCAGFVNNTVLSQNSGPDSITVIQMMELKVRKHLFQLLSEPINHREPASFTKAKTFYRSCLNTTRLEEVGLAPARAILAEIGGWPILEGDSWDESKFDWKETMYKFLDMGLYGDYLLGLGMGLDVENTSRYIIEIGMPDLNLDIKGMDEKGAGVLVEDYLGQIGSSALLLLGDNAKDLNPSAIVEDTVHMVVLEVALSSQTQSREDRHNVTLGVRHMNISELQETFPFLPWKEYIIHVIPEAANITDAEVVNVGDVDFLNALGRLLASTPKRVLANYLAWHAMREHVLPYLTKAARAAILRKGRQDAPRFDICVRLTQAGMRLATASMYVRRHTSNETRTAVKEIVEEIRLEMHNMLESVDWMDPTTRSAATRKVDSMRVQVAFPEELLNDTLLDEHYGTLEIRADSLLDNVLALERMAHSHQTAKFHQDVKKQDWTSTMGFVDTANAYYLHGENSVTVQAGILQPAFFRADRPVYMNYGAIGFAIGHELSHGLDATGSLFNKDGALEDWWDDETKDRFDDKVQCIVELYNGLRSEEVNASVNGMLSQGENIADNAGLNLAYRAYLRHIQRHGEEAPVVLRRSAASPPSSTTSSAPTTTSTSTSTSTPTSTTTSTTTSTSTSTPATTSTSTVTSLPTSSRISEPGELILNPRQMFWVSFASVWCSKETLRSLNTKMRTSLHLPGVHRVNGAVRNQQAFAADFNCPVGSPMNPAHKCQVW